MNKAGNPNWAKGKSGNPGGTPSKTRKAHKAIRVLVSEMLEAKSDLAGKDAIKYKDLTRIEALLKRMWELAMAKGDMRAAKLLLEYAYGQPTQRIEGSTDGVPIQIEIIRGAVNGSS